MYYILGVQVSHAREQLVHHVLDLRQLEDVIPHQQSCQVVLEVVHDDKRRSLEAIPLVGYLANALKFEFRGT